MLPRSSLHLTLALLAGAALLSWGMGCGGPATGSAPATAEARQTIGGYTYMWRGDLLALRVEIGELAYKGEPPMQRAVMDGGLHARVSDLDGADYLLLDAASGLALAPYDGLSLYGVSLQTPDGNAFQCEQLAWPYRGDRRQMALLGHTLVTGESVLLEGDTLVGDPLLLGYEILHVLGVSALDSMDAAGGE
jgi:hypothetical protein